MGSLVPDPTIQTSVQISSHGGANGKGGLLITPLGDFVVLGTRGANALTNVVDEGNHLVKKTTINLNDVVTMTDHTTAGNQGTIPLYNFPQGQILILGAKANVALTSQGGGIGATAALVAAVGSAAVGTADATLTGTEADIIGSTVATETADVGAFSTKSSAALYLDGTVTPSVAHLNLAVPDADSTGNDTILAVGTVVLTWINLGTP